MDEGEHGANDTATSTRPHSRLMKALTPETATFNVLPKGGGARASIGKSSDGLPESARWRQHLAGRTSRRREMCEPGSEKFKEMSAFWRFDRKNVKWGVIFRPFSPRVLLRVSGLVL